jgi:hypothetical protein
MLIYKMRKDYIQRVRNMTISTSFQKITNKFLELFHKIIYKEKHFKGIISPLNWSFRRNGRRWIPKSNKILSLFLWTLVSLSFNRNYRDKLIDLVYMERFSWISFFTSIQSDQQISFVSKSVFFQKNDEFFTFKTWL